MLNLLPAIADRLQVLHSFSSFPLFVLWTHTFASEICFRSLLFSAFPLYCFPRLVVVRSILSQMSYRICFIIVLSDAEKSAVEESLFELMVEASY
jgi:hypothetical protein